MSLLNDQALWQGKFFNGQWQAASQSREAVEVATGQVLGAIGYADGRDIAASAQAAKAAQRDWWRRPYQERQAVMERAADMMVQHQAEIIDWLVKESGSLPLKAGFEWRVSHQVMKHCIGLPASDQGVLLPTQNGKLSMARRLPLGVVGVISPFNFPLYLALRSVAPALALGNAVVLKPDERTAVCSGYVIARIFELAGLPAGLLHVLPGGAEAGEALTLDENIASIQFTGSTQVGRMVGANAGKTLKKVSLELGGKNSLIILDDADIERAAENIVWGAFLHSGQICMTSGKILVQEAIYERLKARVTEKTRQLVVGNPAQENVTIGPLIDEKQCRRVAGLVQAAVAHGARLETGGDAQGVFFRPAVLSGVSKNNPVFHEEIFGPVAVLIPFADDAEAVELANDGDYGLSAGIITGNVGRGMQLGQQLNVGLLHINDQTVNDEVVNPFGGFGASGNATRIGGPANADEFTQWQWMTIQPQAPHYPL